MNADTRETRNAWHHGHDWNHAIQGRDIVSREEARRIRGPQPDDPEYRPDAFDR